MKFVHRPRLLLLSFLASTPLLVGAEGGGCSKSPPITIGGDNDAGTAGKAGSGNGSDPGKGTACGPTHCGEGLECCNASCGMCAAPGEGCIAIACEDPCGPDQAKGIGSCDMALGYAWNGNECEVIGGCSCEGPACGKYDSREQCEAAHSNCGNSSDQCAAQDATGVGACDMFLGFKWDGAECKGIGGCQCSGSACDELFSTADECAAAYSSCSKACESEQATVAEYLAQFTTCELDTDCQNLTVPCTGKAADCTGSFYVNNSVDQDKLKQLQRELNECVNGDPEMSCPVCLMLPPPPACNEGVCGPKTDGSVCEPVATSCASPCFELTAYSYDKARSCLVRKPVVVGCTSEAGGTDDLIYVRNPKDGTLHVGTSGSAFRNAGWPQASESEAELLSNADDCP